MPLENRLNKSESMGNSCIRCIGEERQNVYEKEESVNGEKPVAVGSNYSLTCSQPGSTIESVDGDAVVVVREPPRASPPPSRPI